jgi:hypothetical protein
VELLVDHAHEDEQLARRLLLMTARSQERAPGDMNSLRVLIDQAFAFHEFVPYREVWGYVQAIEEMVDALDELLAEGRAREVVELTEYALTAVENSLEHIDDSDGQMGDLATRLQDLHLDACRQGAPDPMQLAERLFARELGSPYSFLQIAELCRSHDEHDMALEWALTGDFDRSSRAETRGLV